MNQYVKQYQKTTVETASNEKILIMLYDGAIQFLNKAKIALNEKNYEQSHNNLMGAQRILEEFINTIDKDPTYITNYNNARSMICKLDRDELLQELVQCYLFDKQ